MEEVDVLRSLLRQALVVLDRMDGEGSPGGAEADEPRQDLQKFAERLDKLGEIAHLHLQLLEAAGGVITLQDSLDLRRDYYHGDSTQIRSTANLFGTKDSKALLYRDVPTGTPIRYDQPVRMTAEGERLAREYRRVNAIG
jgi:hypothetical protein